MASKKDPVSFLSRVATLFRDDADARPAPDTTATQEPSDEEHARMQEVLQANKRRDDQIRKREFDHLRKMRKSGVGQRTITSSGTARPSVFQASSSFGVQERAATLQKINAIESTIVESWSKAKMQPVTVQEQAPPPPPAPQPEPAPVPEAAEDFDLDFTAMPLPSPPAPPPTERIQTALERALEAAALLFAEGKSEAAANQLQALYRQEATTADDATLLARTLFDLYRTLGASAPFEALALDFAERFGRSPAEWFSLPELLHDSSALVPAQDDSEWICPPVLNADSIVALQARYGADQAPARLNWSALQTLPADACAPLAALLTFWIEHRIQMQWISEHTLLQALERNTPEGDPRTDPRWWHTRLNVLCLLHMQTVFDAVALDYCVLFEVSPPCWQEAWGLVVPAPTTEDYASVISSLLPLEAAPQVWQDLRCTLYGDATGAASAALKILYSVPTHASQITVDCGLLGRLDVEAAAAIVEWSRAYAAGGCEIEFTQLSHLVAILLHSVGLDAYAQLSVRRQ